MATLQTTIDRKASLLDWTPLRPAGEIVYQEITVNAQGRAFRATRNGRQYLVAPATSIVPGVLPGSKGPLYYPPDEVGKNFRAWDGIPLTVYHPTDQRNGEHISVNSPGVMERQGIGEIAKTSFKGNLQHELWFDVDRTREADRRFGTDILNRLERGQPIELSTGLFTENEPAQNGAHDRGRAYSHIARNYKPDHLAILPTGKGACSNQDGCGVLVNAFCATGDGGGQDNSCSSHGDGGGGGSKDSSEHAKHYAIGLEKSFAREQETKSKFPVGKKVKDHFGNSYKVVDHPYSGMLVGVQGSSGYKQIHPDKLIGNDWIPITNEPSDQIDMDPEKACQILKDGTVRGNELSESQKGMFGALCGQRDKATKNEWHPIANFDNTSPYVYCPYCGGKLQADVCTKCGWKADYDLPVIGKGMAGNRDWSQAKRDDLPTKDFAGPGQSFPITSQTDVDAAAHLIGKADDPEAVKRRIIAIAKRRGLSIPDAWKTATENWSTLTTNCDGDKACGPCAAKREKELNALEDGWTTLD